MSCQKIKMSISGKFVISLLGQTIFHAWTIYKLSENFQVQCTMNIERGIAQMKLQLALLLYPKDTNDQLSGLKAGNR